MEFVCPSCKSDNIQRLSLIYEGGMSDINTKTRGAGIGLSRGGIGVGVASAKTKGTSQTAASQRAAPPAKKKYLKPLLGISGIVVLSSLILVAMNPFMPLLVNMGGLAASAWWIRHAFQYNSKIWPALKANWDNSFLCNRCNEMFVLDAGN